MLNAKEVVLTFSVFSIHFYLFSFIYLFVYFIYLIVYIHSSDSCSALFVIEGDPSLRPVTQRQPSFPTARDPAVAQDHQAPATQPKPCPHAPRLSRSEASPCPAFHRPASLGASDSCFRPSKKYEVRRYRNIPAGIKYFMKEMEVRQRRGGFCKKYIYIQNPSERCID